MRDHLAQVVTERPRRGHGNASKKTTGRRFRFYDPNRDYDEPTRLPVARGRQYGSNCKEFSELIRPAAAISAVLHRETLERGPQRTVTEARSPQPEWCAHLGSRAVGDRDGLLHRRRPTCGTQPGARTRCPRVLSVGCTSIPGPVLIREQHRTRKPR